MKLYILVDLEGVSGVVTVQQTRSDSKDYEKSRKLMTGEVAAAITACLEGGVDRVVVDDGHGEMTNLLLDELPEGNVEIITGRLKPFVTGAFKPEKFDAAMFIGYHSKKGTLGGVLDHTVYGRAIDHIRINGVVASEFYIDAATMGYFNVPVIFLAGDDKTVKEAETLIPNMETVVVKRGISRYSAYNLHPAIVRQRIQKGVKRALGKIGKIRPLKLRAPLEIDVVLTDSGLADAAALIPTVKRVNAHSLKFKAKNMQEFCKTLEVICLTSSSLLK